MVTGISDFLVTFLKAGKETRSFKDVMNCLFLCDEFTIEVQQVRRK